MLTQSFKPFIYKLFYCSVGRCNEFKDRVSLNSSIETVLVRCETLILSELFSYTVYENVHAVLNPERIRNHLNAFGSRRIGNKRKSDRRASGRKLSVLMLGIDSISRLNFHRTMPHTRKYFENKKWIELRGYNKMGDNTFPNLMAFLTGQNESTTFSKCTPRIPYGLDNCSLIWYKFRDAGYITAYGEDQGPISTFNYRKVSFWFY